MVLWKKAGFCLLLVSLVWVLSGCGQGGKEGEPGEQIVKVGTDAAYPPFESQTGDQKLVGFDMEVMEAIAKAGGFKVQIQHTGWDPLFEGINSQKVDAGISAITITEDRKEQYDFSDPYFDAKQQILLPSDSQVKTLKELQGKKIGVQSATTGEFVVHEAFGKTYPHLKGYDDTPTAIEDLKLGRLDAVVADKGIVLEYIKRLGPDKFKAVEDPSFPPEQYGIIVKKGNKALLDKINAGLKKIKEDGTYDKLYKKYFQVQ
ncbi:basic amino acid ABC transporter substrate-binding protein [Laceyella putida]|uniref:Basic amino acid ABC transporter substrate-binding protein n=1 Tax=Laceyella putida TaxID=110101 RepID=A0ABW2RGG0_9BACL